MKKHLLLLLGILLTLPATARDFEYTYEGQTIIYTVIDEDKHTCMTKEGSLPAYGHPVEGNLGGDLILPAHPKVGDTEYTLTKIGDFAFFFQPLTSITIPNSVTSIGDYAFGDCHHLTSVVIGNSVTSIGEHAFECCYSLTSVTIGNSVTLIGDYAFCYCNGLNSVIIPNSVTSIGESAFKDCHRLTSVTIGNSVTSIGDYAFSECRGLTSINIPNSVTSIGDYAFSMCRGLTSINIPNSVTSIGADAFLGCVSIMETEFASIEALCTIKFQNVYSNPLLWSEYLVINGEEITDVLIPNSVTSIGNYTFYNCRGLSSVIIPNSVTSIGEAAFASCGGLTSVTIGNSVTSIGEHAFHSCSGLTSITIPNSVSSIGEFAFCRCGLTSITIPNSVSSIGYGAFCDCVSLESINIEKDNINYCSVDGVLFNFDKTALLQYPAGKTGQYNIPKSVTSIGHYAFSGCSNLTSVVIPTSVTSIDEGAFMGCSGLTLVKIPSSVIAIGKFAFRICSGLTTVIIPDSVTSIGNYAFYGCSGLTSIYYGADQPIEGDIKIFFETPAYDEATLYMTEDGAAMARTIYPWMNFKNIEVYDFTTGIDEIVVDNRDIDYDAPYEVYNLNGVKVGNSTDNLATGLYIIRQGGKVSKVMRNSLQSKAPIGR